MCRHASRSSATERSGVGVFADPQLPYEAMELETDDGALLHVRTYGPATGPCIVFVHGFAVCSEYWNPQINMLAENYRVVVYDQRISGRSRRGTRSLSPAVMGDDLSLVLRNVASARRTTLVGHSFGGITVMAWAKTHPDEVAAFTSTIMLADTVGKGFAKQTALLPHPEKHRAIRAPILAALLTAPLPLPTWALKVYRRYFRQVVASRYASAAVVDFMASMIASCPVKTRVEWGRALRGVDVIDGLRNIVVPTTVLVGENDLLTPMNSSQRIANVLRENDHLYRHVTIPRTGHCTNLEDPNVFNAEIAHLVAITDIAVPSDSTSPDG
ncbi:alpha/beta fold hydrolase [Gordonia sp. (in: high G+C Gram-positive bacteria)]|uniref:alpha/beta fold hydrolase n=1 Tax=Gordonia sp. (in: high G+C Gram-positive bacteria) TaxID=84139 RepID=UPI003F982B17